MKLVVLSLIVTNLLPSNAIDFLVDPNVLAHRIAELMEDVVKRKELQDYFDTLTYAETKLDTKETEKIIESINKKFQDQIQAVRNVQKAAEVSYVLTANREVRDCCKTTSLMYVPRYRTQVVGGSGCFSYSHPSTTSFFPSEKLINSFKENEGNFSSIKWQYFATKNDLTLIYPSNKRSCRNIENPYLMPWYFQAFVPQRIRLVVVVDTSVSTASQVNGVPILALIRGAVKDIISPLGFYDKFAVIASTNSQEFNGIGKGSDCYADTFARATYRNKEIIHDEVDLLRARGGMNYEKALSKAFEFFEREYNLTKNIDANRVIVFVANREPEDPPASILETCNRENAKLNNSVRIFSYGLGSANFSVLQQISALNPNASQKGVFTAIADHTKVLEILPKYYELLSTPKNIDPIWTAPYLDDHGLGQIVTTSLPVFVNDTRVGAVGVDMRLDDLVLVSKFFEPNKLSYSFIIDSTGLLLNHPLFPSGIRIISHLVDATAIERDVEFLPVFESMKRGENGNKTFVATRYIRSETLPSNSVNRIKVLSQYIWKKVAQTGFSIGLVLSLNDTSLQISLQDSVPLGSFLHERMDLVLPKVPCSHLDFISTFNASSLFFATRAFVDPDVYIFGNYTVEDIESIRKLLEENGPNKFNIREEAIQDAIATYQAEVLWKSVGTPPLLRHIAWRFLGTKHGVFRSFPAEISSKFYDPTIRHWYVDARANPDLYILSLPHFGAGSGERQLDIDVTKAILEPRRGKENREVAVVVGAVVFLQYFDSIVLDLYSDFITSSDYRFYLTNTVGFMIMAEEYRTSTSTGARHLTELEPDIASVLLSHNIMKRVRCARVALGTFQRQYEIQLPPNETVFRGFIEAEVESCFGFALISVPNTNALILIRTTFLIDCDLSFEHHLTTCNCKDPSTAQTCRSRWEVENSCECPCMESNTLVGRCTNSFDVSNLSATPGPCSPASYLDADTVTAATGLNFLPDLDICYEVFLGLETDVTFSTIVLTSSLSALIVVVLAASAMVYLQLKSKEAKAKVRAKANVLGASSMRHSVVSKTTSPTSSRMGIQLAVERSGQSSDVASIRSKTMSPSREF